VILFQAEFNEHWQGEAVTHSAHKNPDDLPPREEDGYEEALSGWLHHSSLTR
jgi:hypothetical protein